MTSISRPSRRRFRTVPRHAISACCETPPSVLFHGTAAQFDTFADDRLGMASGHPSAELGHYLSACPRIASSFVLKPEIADRAHEVLAGSKVLLDPAWPMSQRGHCPDGLPYETGAQVMIVPHTINAPARISARGFARLIDADYEFAAWSSLREALLDAGYDSLLVEGDPEALKARQIAAEHAPDTWIAFRGSSLQPTAALDWRQVREAARDSLAGPAARRLLDYESQQVQP